MMVREWDVESRIFIDGRKLWDIKIQIWLQKWLAEASLSRPHSNGSVLASLAQRQPYGTGVKLASSRVKHLDLGFVKEEKFSLTLPKYFWLV